jgi:3-phenylpropionate/trans-cinnamate dioxygenase ferredoxin reductase component
VTRRPSFVIVGASLAGAKAAETLRLEGFAGRLSLIGEEAERPYERPPLSKGHLRGDQDRAEIFVHDEAFNATTSSCDLRPGSRPWTPPPRRSISRTASAWATTGFSSLPAPARLA